MKFDILYSDPPWRYADKGCNGAAEKQYSTMTLAEIKALPVKDIASDNCVLFMWATWPLLPLQLPVISAWGFDYKSVAFVWLKCNRQKGEADQMRMFPDQQLDHFYGLGRWTRGNTEMCLLATRGKPKRASKDVDQVIYAPVGRHSEKPAEARQRIVQLMGDRPRLEMFARRVAPGWQCAGNGIDGKDIRHSLQAYAKG